MFSCRIRNVVDELNPSVRPLKFWPLESAQSRNECSSETNAGKAAGIRTAHASIKAVTGRRYVQVTRKRGLVQAVVAGARFVHPTSARRPDPVSSHHLSAGMDLRSPVGLQLGEIFHRAVVVSIEIHPADAVALVDVVIDLTQRVVDADFVGESLDHTDALRIVDGESRTGASDAGTGHSTAGDLLTGCADRDTVGHQIGNRIRDTSSAVAVHQR